MQKGIGATLVVFFFLSESNNNNVNFYSSGIRHVVAVMALLHYFDHQTHKTSCKNNNINSKYIVHGSKNGLL